MKNEHREIILSIVAQSHRRVMGKIAQKELKTSLLLSALFTRFHITNKGRPGASEAEKRSRVQTLIEDNCIHPNGSFQFMEFSIEGFLKDLEREFSLRRVIS